MEQNGILSTRPLQRRSLSVYDDCGNDCHASIEILPSTSIPTSIPPPGLHFMSSSLLALVGVAGLSILAANTVAGVAGTGILVTSCLSTRSKTWVIA